MKKSTAPDIDRVSNLTIAEQIRGRVRESVESGRWVPGDRIPSMRSLAAHYGASLATVERAIRDLSAEGLLAGRAGRGTFVCTPPSTVPTLRMSPSRTMTTDECAHVVRNFRSQSPQAGLLLTADAPDLVGTMLDLLPGVLSELEDIDDLVCEIYGRKENGREIFNPLRQGGKLFLLPVNWGHSAVLINKDLFRKRGVPLPSRMWSFEESLELARAMTSREDNVSGFVMSENLTTFLSTVLRNNGSIFDPTGRHCRLAEPEAVGAAKYLRALAAFGAGEDRHRPQVKRDFCEGRTAMLVASTWQYDMIRHCPFEVGARPMPVGKRDIGIMIAEGYGLRKGSRSRDLAVRMLRTLAGMESWPEHAAGHPAVPFTRALQDDNEVVDVYREDLQHCRCLLFEIDPFYRTERHLDILNLLAPAIRLIRYGGMPVDDVLVQLRDQMNAFLASAGGASFFSTRML